MKKVLTVMVGNIGSGKSTIIKKLRLLPPGYVVICRDSLRYMIGGGDYVFNPKLEPTIFRSEKSILENFMEQCENVIVDEVGISKSMRRPYIDLAIDYGYQAVAIVMPKLTMEESVNRRMNKPHGTPRKTWYEVWKKFDELYEEPTKREGFRDIIKIGREEVGLK